MRLIIVIGFIAYFIWNKQKEKAKKDNIEGKIALCGGLILFTCLSLLLVVFSVSEVMDDYEVSGKAGRLETVERTVRRGDYASLADTMVIWQDYEEEFEPDWERLRMYQYRWLSEMYEKASLRMSGDAEIEGKATEYKKKFNEICTKSSFQENKDYADYLLRGKAGQ